MPSTTNGNILSHWHTLFQDFSTSTQEFYAAVEQAVRDEDLPDIEISRVKFSEGGIGTPEREYLRIRRKRIAFDICSAPYGRGHFFSWWLGRIPPQFGVFVTLGILVVAALLAWILNLMLGSLLPDEGFAAIGVRVLAPLFLFPVVLLVLGYMVEQGMLGDEETIMMLPIIGWLYVFVFNPLTYYRLDTAMMFRDSVRRAVNEVINDLRSEKGLRLLGEEELRPDAEKEARTLRT